MPEGDVVWRAAQRLNAALGGRTLTACDLRWPSLATVDLSGRDVLEVISSGKHLLMRLGASGSVAPVTLHSHLRMEGSWHVHRTGEHWGSSSPTSARAEHGIRAVLANDTWTAVGHRLGMLDLVPTSQEHTLVGHLGPDLLGSSWNAREAAHRLVVAPMRPIGEAVLDQRILAGAGTFYMCEALFLRGVTPWTPTGEVEDVDALVDLLHRLIVANRDRAVQSTTGDLRPGREQWVHSRSGRPCRRCGTTIRVASIGIAPQDRVAFYCPHCQHGPAPTDSGAPQKPLGARSRSARSAPRSRYT